MNTRNSLFIICMLLIVTCGFAKGRVIEGNGKVITKEISVADYNAISLAGINEFEYEQSDAAPYFEITVDENILSYLEIEVKGKTLSVGPKKEGSFNSYNIRPTVCKIKSNSSNMESLNAAGSGNFVVGSPLKINKLEINQAGSGSVRFNKLVEGYKGEFNLAGSGSILISNIKVESLNCSLAGSGEIQVKGIADRASYSVASSGGIKAFGCKVGKADCSIAGSGSIYVNAVDRLDASVMGSGDIRYQGTPALSKSVMGSGKVKSVD